MSTSRRDLLKAAALGGGAAALTGCEKTLSVISTALGDAVPKKLAVCEDSEISPEFHLLSRAAYGPWPGDLERLKSMGAESWIEQQLHPEGINDTACDFRTEHFKTLRIHPGEAYNFKKPVLRDELTRHSLMRAIYSKRQLFEVMGEFWTDHLNIDLNKGDCIYFKAHDDREVIRRHALGNFRDLIRASSASPAMLVYLDGRSNKVSKQSPIPNENYGRELLELHTLGVNGGYTQKDVREAARCLSGWTVNLLKNREGQLKALFQPERGTSYFNPALHDNGEKIVLGHTIPAGGGEQDLERLLDIVCAHPSTAKFIAHKLCVRLVSYKPSAALVQAVADEFSRNKGDIKSMVRLILKSDEFRASRGSLLKRPFRFVVSSLRAVAADTHAHEGLTEWLQRMGQGLFQHPTPDGYPDEERAWLGTLMWRWNYALTLVGGKIPSVAVNLNALRKSLSIPHVKDHLGLDEHAAETLFAHFNGRKAQPHEIEAVLSVPNDSEGLAVLLASPAFQRC